MTGLAERQKVRDGVDFGRSQIVLRGTRHSLRLDVRTIIVSSIFAVLTVAIVLVSLAVGDYPVPLGDVIATLLGQGEPRNHLVIIEWRLPRVLLAVLLGAALAVSGAIFQSLTRNPLGSPDIIGFASGSYTGALIVMLLIGGGYYATASGALVGGIVTAAIVYLLAYRKGVQGFRLIIVGIGVSAMLGAVNTWLIIKADLNDAMRAAVWGAGSLNGLGFEHLLPVVIVSAILIPLAIGYGPTLRQLELGDDAAIALGVRANVGRLVLIVLGVALTALVTAAAGPISFIALAAPQIARRVTKTSGVGIVPSAILGGFLLALADLAAQRLFAPVQLPVGIMTVSIGGLYFIWLLTRESRKN